MLLILIYITKAGEAQETTQTKNEHIINLCVQWTFYIGIQPLDREQLQPLESSVLQQQRLAVLTLTNDGDGTLSVKTSAPSSSSSVVLQA